MQAPLSFSVSGEQLWLSPHKAVYWESTGTLIVSDLHFGKTGHFRKAGIAVPQHVFRNDLQRLFDLVSFFRPHTILIVGDFFHSAENREADLFARWRNDHNGIIIKLVLGNHDIFSRDWYTTNNIEVFENIYSQGPFSFVHEWLPEMESETETYFFSGHIHPGVRLSGMGRQSLRLPCFYFGRNAAILPAFSEFTGLAILEPDAGSRVFVIAEKKVLSLQ